jgi:hypothetical protein
MVYLYERKQYKFASPDMLIFAFWDVEKWDSVIMYLFFQTDKTT